MHRALICQIFSDSSNVYIHTFDSDNSSTWKLTEITYTQKYVLRQCNILRGIFSLSEWMIFPLSAEIKNSTISGTEISAIKEKGESRWQLRKESAISFVFTGVEIICGYVPVYFIGTAHSKAWNRTVFCVHVCVLVCETEEEMREMWNFA